MCVCVCVCVCVRARARARVCVCVCVFYVSIILGLGRGIPDQKKTATEKESNLGHFENILSGYVFSLSDSQLCDVSWVSIVTLLTATA